MSKNWSEEETAALIELYAEFYSSLEKLSKKKPIYDKIADKLKEKHFQRTGAQVTRKIQNLRQQYKDSHPGTTGGEKPTWIHYEAMHKILHERPSLNVDVAATSEIGLEDVIEHNDADDPASPSDSVRTDETVETNAATPNLVPPKKRMRCSDEALKICSETLDFMKQQADVRAKEREETRKLNNEMLNVLSRMASSSEALVSSIVGSTVANNEN